ncbi:hypothetical protein GCM10027073_06610 [Streptomyces chlorus]
MAAGGRQQPRGQVPYAGATVPSGPDVRRAAGKPARPQPGGTPLGHKADITTSPRDFSRAAAPRRTLLSHDLVLYVLKRRFGTIHPGRMRSQFSRWVTGWQPPETEGEMACQQLTARGVSRRSALKPLARTEN